MPENDNYSAPSANVSGKNDKPKFSPPKTAPQNETPPAGVAIRKLSNAHTHAVPEGRTKPGAAFNDEHVGKGGVYTVNDDGVRVPVWEEYRKDDGSIGYRRAV